MPFAAEFDSVGKQYAQRRSAIWAVEAVSLRIDSGTIVGVIGPNRAGKTTLAKLLLSLCAPSTGRVLRLGRPVYERETLARTGYLHEDPAFPRDMTAAGLLDFYGAMSAIPRAERRQRSTALLDRVGLSDRLREPIGGFSKGMIQRLGLAQALLNQPDLLVLDEPTEGLDLSGRQLVHDVIAEQRARGGTVLLISHALGDVESLCDRVVIMIEGKKAFDGPLSSLPDDSKAGEPPSLERSLQALLRQTQGPSS